MEILLIIFVWLLRTVALFLIVVTTLPLLRVGAWMVRICDFPRLQIATACVITAAMLLTPTQSILPPAERWTWITLLTCAAIWQLSHVLKYTPLWKKQIAPTDEHHMSLLVVNLDVTNERHTAVAKLIKDIDPDVLLLIECDRQWHSALESVRSEFQHHVEHIRPRGLGLAMWSKIPFVNPEVRFLVTEDRASIHTHLQFMDMPGVGLIGVHPVPPALSRPERDERYDSRIRDSELVQIAEHVAQRSDEHWIVAGDFNDVAWSHTTRLFARLSGLGDPRIGRGLFNTFHARYPLLRFPLDHVFISPSIRLKQMARHKTPGSDHFAISAQFAFDRIPEQDRRADASDRKEADELIDEGREDAHKHNEAS